MVESKSTSRLPRIAKPVILIQTDTTVGFISQNKEELSFIKTRDSSKPFIKVYSSLASFIACGNRFPKKQKNILRRSLKTSFIVKNKAFRISRTNLNSKILLDLEWNYSTSANAAGKSFDSVFCEDKADIIIINKDGFTQRDASSLIKINNKKIKRIR
ncbi:hypothetical protein JHD48_05505 [Sulfurimonas sp. SAG-AH-194-I05]|nr:hypothetical protein [Sulfurimonas sp. SAG-AH-194-I05]MDF1875182.1 hypothetical protein [Sulfurimonas sp. SAG-AH-194-I05]